MGFRDLPDELQSLMFTEETDNPDQQQALLSKFFSQYYNELVAQVHAQTRTGITELRDAKDVPYQKWFTTNAYYDEQGIWRQLSSDYPSYALVFYLDTDMVRIWRSPAGTNPIVWSAAMPPFVGDILMRLHGATPFGYISMHNKVIGKTVGDYIGSVYYELYAHLWINAYVAPPAPDGYAIIISAAKDATALLDWNAGKTITINVIGRVPVAYNGTGGETNFNVEGKFGGELTHTLTLPETVAHVHTAPIISGSISYAPGAIAADAVTSGNTGSYGWGWAHNNIQPYFTVYYFMNYLGGMSGTGGGG